MKIRINYESVVAWTVIIGGAVVWAVIIFGMVNYLLNLGSYE